MYMLLDSSETLVEAIPLTENVKCNLFAAETHEYLNKGCLQEIYMFGHKLSCAA